MSDIVRLPARDGRGPFAPARPVMNGHYVISSPVKAAAMGLIDAALGLVSVRKPPAPLAPARILFANWAHLGDLTLTLGAIGRVRERFPRARIGLVTSAGARLVAEQSGLVDTVHVVDHWRLNRGSGGRATKLARYRETLAVATRDIRALEYEVGIDFYFRFPATHPLFRRWGIPVRVGFDGTGGGPLLTHPVRWQDADRPISEHYAALLEAAWPGIVERPEQMRPRLAADRIAPLPDALRGMGGYVVLHPGAGAPFKDWGADRWHALLDLLPHHPATRERTLVLTGAGAAETAYAAALADERPEIVNMAGTASWAAFVAIIAHAAAVVCPDTVTGHVAAQVDTPVVSLFTGTNNPHQWAPNTPHGRVLVADVLCAPCQRLGCDAMGCIRDIGPEDVIAALADVLRAGRGSA